MPQPTQTTGLTLEEVEQAVATLVPYLQAAGARFSISGGAASLLIRRHHGVAARVTEDIDLVVQPSARVTAESISSYLLQAYPTVFVGKELYGTIMPALAFTRPDGSVKHVEIEIFDVSVWPQRPQYNLDDPANEVTTLCVLGVDTPVFSARWLIREKIVTAFERRGSRKEATDLDDAIALLNLVEDNSIDMTNFEDAVRHIYSSCPEDRQILELKIHCPNVLGE
ncbi:hypothetical protein CCM_06372 [Cordyceps militaris CM01]|uniref:Nucleotidyl transferase AbiEii toxin, Type IV TA system n=1 Tax=Cordyceps militaris (strain CM01) TaxID=983644 RepID=G3JKD3_CORMM|nr:uncharacterized protein CCM_06372 [Cordyceps militaris CM01]EGX92211.1 hypothetical protein CCM_06372 [Cordyceps militaris CM01]